MDDATLERLKQLDRNDHAAPPKSLTRKNKAWTIGVTSAERYFFPESEMRVILLIIGDIVGKQPHEVLVVQSNHVV